MEGPPHPIAAVANKAAQLSDILELQIESPSSPPSLDNAFSTSTRNALRRCPAFPATETIDGRPVVDSGSYLKAVLGAAGYEHETECKALAEAIVGSNTDRLRIVVGQTDTPVGTAALLLEPLEPGEKVIPDLKPQPAPDGKPAHWDELAAFWRAVPQASRGAIRDAVNSIVAALPGGAGL